MFKELGRFIWQNKKWWMIPPIIVFIIFGVCIYITTASPVSPFIYMMF